MQDETPKQAAIPTEINIAPRGKSWLHGELINGEQGYPTRQTMESAERAAVIQLPAVPPRAAWPWLTNGYSHDPGMSTSDLQVLTARAQASWDKLREAIGADTEPATVPMAEAWELSAADTEQQTGGVGQDYNQGLAEGLRICAKDVRAALAATPAAAPSLTAPPLTPDEARQAARFARLMNGPSDTTQPHEYAMAGALALAAKIGQSMTTAAQVVLPEPQHWVLETQALDREFDCTGVQKKAEHWKAIGLNPTALFTEQQLRAALLAGVSAPAAQAVASIYVTADGQRECDDWKVPLPIGRNLLYTAPQAQADARDEDTFEQRMSDWQHGDALDAERYRWLRSRDLETISDGGVFAGMTPQNVILNEEDLDEAVDAAIAAQAAQGGE